ncbi:MAG: hypothetical protein M1837_004864 [Sclerophora amabilis]|nr:MAG: hypothetical protein M1837_004864 [Sclerophora amabilis]
MDTSYLTTQVATIINQLHGLFDEIGVPSNERDSRESELFNALSETLHNQLRLVSTEKNEMTEEAHRIIKTIKQMEASLEGTGAGEDYNPNNEELRISYPLLRCLQTLKEKHGTISKIHKERFEQVKKLVQALQSYSSHLEPSFVEIPLPPTSSNASVSPSFDLSPSYVTALDNEFTRVYEAYARRVSIVQGVSEEIITLWAELGTPQAQTDTQIVQHYRDSPEQLGLHEADLARLKGRKDKLVDEKRGREKRLKELKATVEGLWDRLGVEQPERKTFLNSNRGCGIRVINEFEDELSRLNELKRQNLHLFVEDARYKLQELWDGLYFSEEEMLEFTPAFSDVYSDALLSAHEGEISRLEALKEQRAPTLELIDKHRMLIKEREALASSSQDASRLMLRGQKGEKRDPTRLLREEKMRKRIAKELPKIAVDLRKILEQWEDEYGRPFLVHGERYLDELAAAETKAPPRSKTPSGLRPQSRNQKSVPPSAPPSRAASTTRAIPPARSGAKTPTGTIRKNAFASSISTAGGHTPSKIPARVPLGNMNHGNNSPERAGRPAAPNAANTTRKMGPPKMAPPPKMRDLYVAPPAPTPAHAPGYRSESAMSSDGSVRPVSPEDVYDDRDHLSYAQSSRMHSHQAKPQTYEMLPPSSSYAEYHHYQQSNHTSQAAAAAGSRQESVASSTSNAISGSENWETYDDVSDPEPDASETYYAKLRAARGKRYTPEGGHTSPYGGKDKRPRGMRGGGVDGRMETLVEQGGQMIKVSGSEAGWTSEDAF